MAGRMRKSQTAWARREYQGQWRRRLGGSRERKEACGAALGEAKVRERTGAGPRDLADLKDYCDFGGCANGGSHTREWCSLTHSLER